MRKNARNTPVGGELEGERLCRRSQLRLIVLVSMGRVVLVQLLPQAQNAAWWLAPVCQLPGLAVCLLGGAAMRSAGADTLNELVATRLGSGCERGFSWALAAMTLADATLNLMLLISYFTDGIGTEGTRQTIAVLTFAALICCRGSRGTHRAIWFLRWSLRLMLAIVLIDLLGGARADHLFPMSNGKLPIPTLTMTSFQAGALLPILHTQPVRTAGRGRAQACLLPAAVSAALAAAMAAIPFEVWDLRNKAAILMTWGMHLSMPVRLIFGMLLMMGVFLAVSAQAHLCAEWVVRKNQERWTAVACAVICLLQAAEPNRSRFVIATVEGVLFVSVALMLLAAATVKSRRHA